MRYLESEEKQVLVMSNIYHKYYIVKPYGDLETQLHLMEHRLDGDYACEFVNFNFSSKMASRQPVYWRMK